MTNFDLPTDPREFHALLEGYGGNAAAMSRATGISVDRIKRLRLKFRSAAASTATYVKDPSWGLGGPKLLMGADGVPKGEVDQRVIGLFDLHFPHHEEDLVSAMLGVVQRVKPHLVIIGGDLYDLSLLSRWEIQRRAKTAPGRLYQMIRSDLKRVEDEFLRPLREAAGPECVIRFIEGNHDERLRKWLVDDDLAEGIEMAKEWMGFERHGVIWHPRCGFLLRPDFLVRHGATTVTNAAKKEQDDTRCGGWIGHGHRKRMWHTDMPDTGRRLETWMSPVMCRKDYDYGPGESGLAPWPQGFLVGTFSVHNDHDYTTEVAEWREGFLRFRGERIKP